MADEEGGCVRGPHHGKLVKGFQVFRRLGLAPAALQLQEHVDVKPFLHTALLAEVLEKVAGTVQADEQREHHIKAGDLSLVAIGKVAVDAGIVQIREPTILETAKKARRRPTSGTVSAYRAARQLRQKSRVL